eukprot:scaffold171_cov151-Skeletonema_menzelii.AAC.12
MDGDWLGFWYERALFDQRYNINERERAEEKSFSLSSPLFSSQYLCREIEASNMIQIDDMNRRIVVS